MKQPIITTMQMQKSMSEHSVSKLEVGGTLAAEDRSGIQVS